MFFSVLLIVIYKKINYNKDGDNMKNIEIFINNLYREIYINIDVKNNIAKINNQEKRIETEFIEGLLRIIRTWDNNYTDNKVIDGEEVIIKISTNEGTEVIKGKNPKNYTAFRNWVGRLYE